MQRWECYLFVYVSLLRVCLLDHFPHCLAVLLDNLLHLLAVSRKKTLSGPTLAPFYMHRLP